MTPQLQTFFWWGGIVCAVIALATPAVHVLGRLTAIEIRLAELHQDMNWVKKMLRWSKEDDAPTTRS